MSLNPHAARVERCVALAGAMPDPAAHRRYLTGLNDAELEDRAAALAEETRSRVPKIMGRDGTNGTYARLDLNR